MSGHNKWSTIKHKKGKLDAQRGKVFTKIIREIQSAVREGHGSDPETNARLRLAIAKAKDANMPQDNIKRAIQKASGADGGIILEEITYEGYGPGGVAILIHCLTDNKNRTLPIVRNILNKKGGSMGNAGSVAYLFASKGQFVFVPGSDETKIMESAIEAGGEDVRSQEDGSVEVVCQPEDFETLRNSFEQSGLQFDHAEIAMIPANTINLDLEQTRKNLEIIEALEDEDDVQNVYSNLDVPDEVLAEL